MTSRRDALVTLAAAGAITLAGCSPPPRRSTLTRLPPPRPSEPPSPPPAPSHALTGGNGPDGSVVMTGSAGVALTFDDGPDPGNTPKLLDLLGEHGIKATFSLVGWRARDNPDLVHRIAAEGHTVANHSWQHLMDLAHRPKSYIEWDLTETTKAIQHAAPDTPVRYFRAPGGNFTRDLVALGRQYGLTPLFWNVDPRDWDSANYGFGASMVRHIVQTVESNVRPGMIVLSHDCKHPDTISAYGILLPWLKQKYSLIPLPV
jgi:peptidoglycan/xylan/chitin deacetylase (PgdA/CDA1 family)